MPLKLLLNKIYLIFLLIPLGVRSQDLRDSIISKEGLYQTVSFLSSDSMEGRLMGSPGMYKAAAFIKSSFIKYHIGPPNIFPDFFDTFTIAKNILGINVMGALPGKESDSIIIISAHYDHIGKGYSVMALNNYPSRKDSIYNGANDNATGVAAMLALAKYFSITKENSCTILFIAFSGEEFGLLGSEHFSGLIDNRNKIKAVINFDMLGRPYKNNHCFYAGFLLPDRLDQINQDVKARTHINSFLKDDPFPEQDLERRSDHYSFYDKVYESFTVMATSPYDKYYHSVDDEINTIDFNFLTFLTKNLVTVVEHFFIFNK